MTRTAEMVDIQTVLPLSVPTESLPCPICGSKVIVTGVHEWETESGKIVQADFDCETEPDLDSDEYLDWFHDHHENMPYVYWLPYEQRLLDWLNQRYYRGDSEC